LHDQTPVARPRGNPRFLRRFSHLLATVALAQTGFLVFVFAIFQNGPFAWWACSAGFPPTEPETIPKGAFLRRVARAEFSNNSAAVWAGMENVDGKRDITDFVAPLRVGISAILSSGPSSPCPERSGFRRSRQ
jgi:hypothetical protein